MYVSFSFLFFQVEDAIDGHFKRGCGGDGGSGGGGGRHGGGGTVRINRSRPVIPPLLELHLIQLGNKVGLRGLGLLCEVKGG